LGKQLSALRFNVNATGHPWPITIVIGTKSFKWIFGTTIDALHWPALDYMDPPGVTTGSVGPKARQHRRQCSGLPVADYHRSQHQILQIDGMDSCRPSALTCIGLHWFSRGYKWLMGRKTSRP
jgi:hypothetical protein